MNATFFCLVLAFSFFSNLFPSRFLSPVSKIFFLNVNLESIEGSRDPRMLSLKEFEVVGFVSTLVYWSYTTLSLARLFFLFSLSHLSLLQCYCVSQMRPRRDRRILERVYD